MNRLARTFLTVAVMAATPAIAWAQGVGSTVTAAGYEGLPTKAPTGTDSGIQVSEGVLMHTGVGVEAGVDTNVFYRESNRVSSPILRVIPYAGITNATRTGVAPSGMFFDLNAALVYREYLTGNQQVAGQDYQRAFMPTFSGLLDFSSGQQLSLSLGNTFVRMEEPPYVANSQTTINGELYNNVNEPIIRNMNQAAAQLRWAPGGGRLQGTLRLTNTVDIFSTAGLQLANSDRNDLLLDVSWKWLPKTAVFMQAAAGYIWYWNSRDAASATPGAQYKKPNSFPVLTMVGLRGLLTEKSSVTVSAGYTMSFYEYGPAPGGLGRLALLADYAYRPTVLTTVSVGTAHQFQNSVVGNFYYVDALYASIRQQIAGRVTATLSGRYEYRRFQIPAGDVTMLPAGQRTDHFVTVGLAADYHIKRWMYAGVGYSFQQNISDYLIPVDSPTGTPGTPNYVKQQLFARIGVTY